MKLSVILFAALLSLAPLAVQASDPGEADVTYLGHGQFQFKGDAYDYDALVKHIRAVYRIVALDHIVVDMGQVASQSDRAQVCQLKRDLGVPLTMHLTVDGDVRELFCN